MLKIFNSPFRVTQAFGVNAAYYSQFGLKAHEGVDLQPTTVDWAIFSMPYIGTVVKDTDNATMGGAYGINVSIWYPSIKKIFQYCHLSSNRVSLGQQLSPISWIGMMGTTGNSTGPHLHLNEFETDGNGVKLNTNNGYFGGVDPLPFISANPPGGNEVDNRDVVIQLYEGIQGRTPSESEVNQKLAALVTPKQLASELVRDAWFSHPDAYSQLYRALVGRNPTADELNQKLAADSGHLTIEKLAKELIPATGGDATVLRAKIAQAIKDLS